jgi:glycosyltransferase involved in cell wall biosynthesis
MSDLSVQVPVKNPGAGFAVFLGSLAAQEAPGLRWELIVADDGSDEPVEGRFDLSSLGCSRVVVVRLEGSGNRPRARNAALAAADAPVSFLTDADLRLGRDVLAFHARAHRDGDKDVVRGARINAWSETASPWQRWFDTRACNLDPPGPMLPRHLVTGNLSLSTELLRGEGGFDESIDRYGGEDTELGIRLGLGGARMWRDPSAKVYHLDDVTMRMHSEKMVEFGGSGLRQILGKHPEASGLLGTGWMLPLSARPSGPAELASRILARAAIAGPVYRCVLRWMEVFGHPSFLFTYLSVAACLRGYTGRGS